MKHTVDDIIDLLISQGYDVMKERVVEGWTVIIKDSNGKLISTTIIDDEPIDKVEAIKHLSRKSV